MNFLQPFGFKKLNDQNHMRGGKLFHEFLREVVQRFRPRKILFDGSIFFQNLAGTGANETIQKSSKSKPSSRFFGHLKFLAESFPPHSRYKR